MDCIWPEVTPWSIIIIGSKDTIVNIETLTRFSELGRREVRNKDITPTTITDRVT